MKVSARITLLTLILSTIIWEGCQGEEECELPPCPTPNINDLVELTLSFQDKQAGEQIQLVRINRLDQSVIDTIQLELPESKEINIGHGGIAGFTEPTSGDVFEEATLDYRVLVSSTETRSITNIEIERLGSEDACTCPDYQLSTLELDGQRVEVNAKRFTVSL